MTFFSTIAASITGLDKLDHIPLDLELTGLIANKNCINVSALPWNEGETSITFGWFDELPPQAAEPRFDGLLNTPNNYVDVFDANNPRIFTLDVPGKRTRVRVWMNRRFQRDDVIVAVG